MTGHTHGHLLPVTVSKARMFEQSGEPGRNVITDRFIRGAIAVAFVVFGVEKFSDSSWVKFFQQVGAGQWFRYATGVVEILGGVLVLIPATATAGLAILVCTMGSAVLILTFVLGHPGDSFVAGSFFVGLLAFALTRRSR